MNRPHLQSSLLCAVFFIFCNSLIAQELRTFNQNASRSNHTRAFNQNSSRSNYSGLSISFTPVYSSAVNSNNDSLLFRGNGAGFRFGADYFFGKASIGFSSGFSSSAPDDATINNFLKRSAVPPDQLQITKAKQQNMYLLLGPSVRFGNTVEFYAHAKAGLFINNSGMVNIQQKGAQRAAYRIESTSKSIYPGFFTGLGVQYNTKSDVWSFGIGADYMNTKSEVNNFDARRGSEALKLSRNITDIVTGITIRYNIFSPRDQQSGQSTGKRVLPTVNKREFGISEQGDTKNSRVLPTVNKRVLPTVNKKEIAIDESGVHLTTNQNCGPVTMKSTYADGSSEEMTFSCPEDAANYTNKMKTDGGMPNRISMNVTTPKQTQGATFGERTYAVPHILEGKGIVSGRLTWPSAGNTGIITNLTINNSSPRSGSTTLNSQTSSTRQTQQSSFGTLVRLSAREAGSGIATGKRSREAGSGMATGRRQYEPIFIEDGGSVCDPCIAEAKLSPVKNNPLYKDNGMSGTNPLYNENKRTTADDDCDGIAGIDVYLVDAESGAVASKTITGKCGDFFFANVPDGDYIVRVSGSFTGKKGYDVYLKSKTDLLGSIEQSSQPIQLFLNTDDDNDGMSQKAGISTSRSNIRTKSIAIIEADLDGDGEFESLKAIGQLEDGSSQELDPGTITVSNASGAKGIVLGKEGMRINKTRMASLKSASEPAANNLTSIVIKNTGGKLTATGTFSDGSSRDVTESLVAKMDHTGVTQYNITVGDLDGDGAADAVVKTKTKSNQSNDRIATGDVNGDGIIWSPKSNIKMINVAAGDVNGDGVAEIVGGFLPGGGIVSAARAGDPVHGVDVKLGLAGKTIQTASSNEYGEVEFTNLASGTYTLVVEQDIYIDDETLVTVGSQTKVQDHNSSRSNKTASLIADDDEDDNGSPTMKARNNNTVRSNRTDNALTVINDNNDPNDITIDEGGQSKPKGKNTLQKNINTSESNLKGMLSLLDALEEQLNTDESNAKTVINTSRSNIKNQRTRINELEQVLNNLWAKDKETAFNELEQKRNESDLQFIKLQQSLKQLGSQYNSISNVLKTRHDIAMNSIRNMK